MMSPVGRGVLLTRIGSRVRIVYSAVQVVGMREKLEPEPCIYLSIIELVPEESYRTVVREKSNTHLRTRAYKKERRLQWRKT